MRIISESRCRVRRAGEGLHASTSDYFLAILDVNMHMFDYATHGLYTLLYFYISNPLKL